MTQQIQRFGMVIGLKQGCEDAYRRLHAGPGVRDLLHAVHIRNFSIYLQIMPDGHLYEFAHYDYVGDDYPGDMARLAANPRNQAWLAQCDQMQIPLPGHASWAMMESIYFQE